MKQNFPDKILMFESILDSNPKEELINKYILTLSRNLLNHLKKTKVIKKLNSLSIKKTTLIAYLRHIGYSNHSKKYISNIIHNFERSAYISSFDNDYIILKSKTHYESSKSYLTYYVDIENTFKNKFTFNAFKKESITFLYSKPVKTNAKNNKRYNKKSGMIYFTSQSHIAKILNISQTAISLAVSDMLKIYAFKNISVPYKSYQEARFHLTRANKERPCQYSICTSYIDKEWNGNYRAPSVVNYYLVRLDGSKLIRNKDNDHTEYYTYKKYIKKKNKKNHNKKSFRAPFKRGVQTLWKNNNTITIADGKKEILVKSSQLHGGTLVIDDGEWFNDYMFLLGKDKNSALFHTYNVDIKKKGNSHMIKTITTSNEYRRLYHKNRLKRIKRLPQYNSIKPQSIPVTALSLSLHNILI